ncbi:n-terminal domain protein [Ichthyophthirius multifiliis]|uniref:N-terminal domain protein n=1 Tax=Ichthyophthirius multifiliis TaxID=5932 RepID=G0QMH2_ICHMU|nr:n-terminal domain protein [Ichthyophthirius multifiliis]EGR33582.1 n-terminal domain protein [Ichthyophthirius multifiliis]|eukprot:XP_004037568.1 n-terminal domain protein [Ichthyophthirius multifiliis]
MNMQKRTNIIKNSQITGNNPIIDRLPNRKFGLNLQNFKSQNNENSKPQSIPEKKRLDFEQEYETINSKDSNNPCLVSEYQQEIFKYLQKQEQLNKIDYTYLLHQPEITSQMRTVLVDWLVEIHLQFRLLPETLHLTIYIIDKYLSIKKIEKSQLYLLGITSLYISSKYEEIYPPSIEQFIETCDISQKEILVFEGDILKNLNFKITVPTSYRFAIWYSRIGQLNTYDVCFVQYLLDLALGDYRYLKYPVSKIAASAVFLCNKIKKQTVAWNPLLKYDSGYSEQQLMDCVKDLIFSLKHVHENNCQAIKKKYQREAFQRVGNIQLIDKRKKDE